MADLRPLTIAVWRVVMIAGVILLVIGALLLPVNLTLGLGLVAVALGFAGVSLSFIAEILITEIRQGEVDEKIAMMKAYVGDEGARVVSDLEALEAVSRSATRDQADKIEKRGRTLLAWLNSHFPNSETEARTVLNRILERFGKAI